MEILLKSYRGKIEDLYTFGSIAVVDKDGKIVYSAGDPKEVSFPRSSAKLIQAMVPLSLGAKEKFNLSHEEIALCLPFRRRFSYKNRNGNIKKNRA